LRDTEADCSALTWKELRAPDRSDSPEGPRGKHIDPFSEKDAPRSNLTGANLTRADLTRANLANANLAGANLTGADLLDADLTDANLRNANLTHAALTDVNLTNANLTGADLTGAWTMRATGIDLTNVDPSKWPTDRPTGSGMGMTTLTRQSRNQKTIAQRYLEVPSL
jgi:uncharacterized protein YjbI with pentapeptide repeats